MEMRRGKALVLPREPRRELRRELRREQVEQESRLGQQALEQDMGRSRVLVSKSSGSICHASCSNGLGCFLVPVVRSECL